MQLKAKAGKHVGKIVVIERVGEDRFTCRSPGSKEETEILYKCFKAEWGWLYDRAELQDKGIAFSSAAYVGRNSNVIEVGS